MICGRSLAAVASSKPVSELIASYCHVREQARAKSSGPP